MLIFSRYSVKLVREEESVLYHLDSSLNCPSKAARALMDLLELHNAAQEVFGFIALDTKMQPVGLHVISKGSLNATAVTPREVFKAALLNNAASIILFHNHTSSGDPTPSAEDIELTKNLVEAGKIMKIHVHDHIIIGDPYWGGPGWFSFAYEGLI